MIQVIGYKRLLMLAILFGANVFLAGMVYYVVMPQKSKTDVELNTAKAAVQARRAEVSRMKADYEQVQEQKDRFEKLRQSGFFGKQDRAEAKNLIASIQSTSRVLGATYQIGAAALTEEGAVAESGHVLMSSPVSVSISALDDLDYYSFMYWMENSFPGHVGIKSFNLERKIDIDDDVLRQIGNGVPTVLISGSIDFSWSTMIPKESVTQQLGQPLSPPKSQ